MLLKAGLKYYQYELGLLVYESSYCIRDFEDEDEYNVENDDGTYNGDEDLNRDSTAYAMACGGNKTFGPKKQSG